MYQARPGSSGTAFTTSASWRTIASQPTSPSRGDDAGDARGLQRVLLEVERQQHRGQRVARRHAERELLDDRVGLAAVASRPRGRRRCARSCRRCTGSCAGRPRGRGAAPPRAAPRPRPPSGSGTSATIRGTAPHWPPRDFARPPRSVQRTCAITSVGEPGDHSQHSRGHMASYLHESVALYLENLIDWDEYWTRRKGDGADVAAERGAQASLLETCAEICAALEPEARSRLVGSGEARRTARSCSPTTCARATRSCARRGSSASA